MLYIHNGVLFSIKGKENLFSPTIWMNLEDVMPSGLPSPPPGDLSGPGVKPATFTSPALARGFFATSATWEAQVKEASHKKTNTLVFHLNEVPKRVKLCSRVIIVRVWGRQKWGVVQSCKQSFMRVEFRSCKMKAFWSSVACQCAAGWQCCTVYLRLFQGQMCYMAFIIIQN